MIIVSQSLSFTQTKIPTNGVVVRLVSNMKLYAELRKASSAISIRLANACSVLGLCSAECNMLWNDTNY